MTSAGFIEKTTFGFGHVTTLDAWKEIERRGFNIPTAPAVGEDEFQTLGGLYVATNLHERWSDLAVWVCGKYGVDSAVVVEVVLPEGLPFALDEDEIDGLAAGPQAFRDFGRDSVKIADAAVRECLNPRRLDRLDLWSRKLATRLNQEEIHKYALRVFKQPQIVGARRLRPCGGSGRSSGSASRPAARETWYHMTDRAKFRLDPNFTPADNAFALEDRSGVKGIYLAPDIERWVNGQGYLRPFLVELTADAALKKAPGVHGRYHGEMFVPATAFDRLRIERVIPIDAFAREQYGSYGWIEDTAREEFDTGRAIPPRAAHYPFHGYRYTGPDVREMDAATVARLKKAWRKALKLRG